MAERVVDGFEVVDVAQDDGERKPVALCPLEFSRKKNTMQMAPVIAPGQMVLHCLISQKRSHAIFIPPQSMVTARRHQPEAVCQQKQHGHGQHVGEPERQHARDDDDEERRRGKGNGLRDDQPVRNEDIDNDQHDAEGHRMPRYLAGPMLHDEHERTHPDDLSGSCGELKHCTRCRPRARQIQPGHRGDRNEHPGEKQQQRLARITENTGIGQSERQVEEGTKNKRRTQCCLIAWQVMSLEIPFDIFVSKLHSQRVNIEFSR
ncbi:hypothetical protein [Paraburkholderia sp. SIMBA_053]|uniref:hypothetical protein n=1 Tax=Paraburkholderia sp. SIMBA_053 TaxID=3085794 RepID=UPI00397BE0CF